ncbi:hypothetical protein ACJMK2_016140 [Sinanodonta woodiana]|uniref:UBP-type domain-containing protein n=1 Tax=Sinanodonta woodiana TaxID=1069815 RepID=A0ABD3UUR4_SINWO
MTHMLSSLANGKVVLVLEGGYNLVSISNCMAACTSVLLGDPCPHWAYKPPKEGAVNSIQNVIGTHKKYWKSLKFAVGLPSIGSMGAEVKVISDKTDAMAVQREAVLKVGDNTQDPKDLTEQRKDHTEVPTSEDTDQLADCLQNIVVGGEVDSASNRADSTSTGSAFEGGAAGGSQPTENSSMKLLKEMEAQGVEQMYAVQPLPWCPHLEHVTPVPTKGLNTSDPCEECGNVGENWVCLVCYKVYCGRYVNEHMVMHGETENHPIVLSYADLSVWCYGCNNYVHNDVIQPAKAAAHLSKFDEPLPGM